MTGINTRLSMAIDAFRAVERAELLRDRKDREMRRALLELSNEEMAVYAEETDKILAEYAAKREKEGLR